MKNLRKNLKSKKGFTLIELIVVIVILAILMAIMLPSLTGYIDQANEQGALVEARNVYAALQTMKGLQYGTGAKYFEDSSNKLTSGVGGGEEKVNALIGVSGRYSYGTAVGGISSITFDGNSVSKFVLTTEGHTVTYEGNKFTAKKKS